MSSSILRNLRDKLSVGTGSWKRGKPAKLIDSITVGGYRWEVSGKSTKGTYSVSLAAEIHYTWPRYLGCRWSIWIFFGWCVDESQIRTSQIKQAISVIHMYVHRCLLGIESGVPKSVLGHEKWDLLQQYTLWEVHRKIFLYPENWIEPALWDDKSQLFNQFEATLMQKYLSLKSFLQGIKSYIYDLDGISSLNIVAYVH